MKTVKIKKDFNNIIFLTLLVIADNILKRAKLILLYLECYCVNEGLLRLYEYRIYFINHSIVNEW